MFFSIRHFRCRQTRSVQSAAQNRSLQADDDKVLVSVPGFYGQIASELISLFIYRFSITSAFRSLFLVDRAHLGTFVSTFHGPKVLK